MTESESKLFGIEFIGIVENNLDPDKKQRIQIRIPYLHGSKELIPTEALPWAQPYRDNNGLTFSVPEINKIVNVTFPTGNPYYPVYKNAQHLNINLQKKIEEYDEDDYASFVALCYNHNTQMYFDNENFNLYYKKNGVYVDEEDIILRRRDKTVNIKLGSDNADEPVICGNKLMDWMDTLIDALTKAYIGNSGVNVVPTPDLLKSIAQYKSSRHTFLSKNTFVTNNENSDTNDIKIEGIIGDNYTKTFSNKSLNAVYSANSTESTSETEETKTTTEVPVVEAVSSTNSAGEPKALNTEEDLNILNSVVPIGTIPIPPDLSDPEVFDIYDDGEYGTFDESTQIFDESDEIYEYDELEEVNNSYISSNNSGSGSTKKPKPGGPPVTPPGFDYKNKKWFKVYNDVNYDTTNRSFIDHTKLPKPNLTFDRLIKWKRDVEGDLSDDKSDTAYENGRGLCPTPKNGKKYHTNAGVTYKVWKNGYGSNKDKKFLAVPMTNEDWSIVFAGYKQAANNRMKGKGKQYESVLALLTSHYWGGMAKDSISSAERDLGIQFGINSKNSEAEQIAALFNVRYTYFMWCSSAPKHLSGWVNTGQNKLLKIVYG